MMAVPGEHGTRLGSGLRSIKWEPRRPLQPPRRAYTRWYAFEGSEFIATERARHCCSGPGVVNGMATRRAGFASVACAATMVLGPLGAGCTGHAVEGTGGRVSDPVLPGVDAAVAPALPGVDAAVGDGACPVDGVRGTGRHRLFVQGHGAQSDARGVYPLLHEWEAGGADAALCDDARFVDDLDGDGRWQVGEEPRPLGPRAIVHGEHFLITAGAFVEFEITLCEDITGEVTFYIPNFDHSGSEALHELFVVHDGQETLIASVIDDEAGQSGYNPFIRQVVGEDPDVVPGDILRLRSTNLNGVTFSVMVWQPPSEYESWLLVTVP